MKDRTIVAPVKGGYVTREADSGRLIDVRTPKGTFKSSAKTEQVVKEASAKHSAALKRLADR